MRPSTDIQNQINGLDPDLRLIYTRAKSARLVIEQLEQQAFNALALHRGYEDDNPANQTSAVLAFANSDTGKALGSAVAILNVLERHQNHKDAAAILDQLHAELAQAIEAEAQATREEQLALQAVTEAEEDAREKLTARIEKDPKVLKAREALQSVRRLGEPLLTN